MKNKKLVMSAERCRNAIGACARDASGGKLLWDIDGFGRGLLKEFM